MRFDTKIAIVLRADLLQWQQLNVTAVYTMEMFGTGSDDDNRAVVLAATMLDLAGIAVYGPRNAVGKVIKGVRLHP